MRTGFFGIQLKLALLLLSVLILFAIAGGTVIAGFWRIEASARVVTEHETPFVRSIEEALSAMIGASSAAEQALDVDDPEKLSLVKELEQHFGTENTRFRMFIAAITWGSESDAFKHSDDGRSYRAWQEAGLENKLVVLEPPSEQAQLAAEVGVYYDGFVNNVEKAFQKREEYLSLLAAQKTTPAEAAKDESKVIQALARHYADLTTEKLRAMVERSNETTAENAKALTDTERAVRIRIFWALSIGLILALVVSIFFSQRAIVKPIMELTAIAESFGTGSFSKRARIKSRDEFALLGLSFNVMADKLAAYTANLEHEVAVRTEELKQNNQELSVANDRLRELDEAKSEFISVAAHQLRTPLSVIKWILGLLIEDTTGNLTSEQKGLIYKGFESNERMIALINEMLVVTRIESGKVVYKFAPTHMENIIDSILLDFGAQAHVRKVDLSFERPPKMLPYIKADPEKMRGVLQNLIENAMHYTNDGGRITLTAGEKDGFIQVSVRDSGIGIPQKQQSSIFNKFFRADNAVKQQTDGSGLGLFISKAMVERHGGKIWFESIEGKGTTFFFTVPVDTKVA